MVETRLVPTAHQITEAAGVARKPDVQFPNDLVELGRAHAEAVQAFIVSQSVNVFPLRDLIRQAYSEATFPDVSKAAAAAANAIKEILGEPKKLDVKGTERPFDDRLDRWLDSEASAEELESLRQRFSEDLPYGENCSGDPRSEAWAVARYELYTKLTEESEGQDAAAPHSVAGAPSAYEQARGGRLSPEERAVLAELADRQLSRSGPWRGGDQEWLARGYRQAVNGCIAAALSAGEKDMAEAVTAAAEIQGRFDRTRITVPRGWDVALETAMASCKPFRDGLIVPPVSEVRQGMWDTQLPPSPAVTVSEAQRLWGGQK